MPIDRQDIFTKSDSNYLMEIFTKNDRVIFHSDPSVELETIICINDLTLGPGLGGVRFYDYSIFGTEKYKFALNDVMRLSEGMTLKSSFAGLNLGGAKAVIIGDPNKLKTKALLKKFGRLVNDTNGRYVTAPDVNTSSSDMSIISTETKWVTCLPQDLGGGSDPSPFTARGVYLGMKAAVKKYYGTDSLKNKIVLVDGVGKVGSFLVDLLAKEEANIIVTDINERLIEKVINKHKVKVLDYKQKFSSKIDVYAPCAIGASINTNSINLLKNSECKIICGGENNQLEDIKIHDALLKKEQILYVPDFAVNSGGVINCAVELEGYSESKVNNYIDKIYNSIIELLNYAEDKQISTHKAAVSMAYDRINEVKRHEVLSK